MIETYLLEHLATFKKHKTLSDSAKALHLTQPTLTRSMNRLEETFGVPLFVREKKRLYLNENGMLAAEYAEDILEMQKKMFGQVRALDRLSNTITVGSCAPGPLMELLPLLTSTFSQMTISTELKTETELLDGLKDHTYQMVILNHPADDPFLYSQKCGSEQLCASLIPTHKYARENTVSFADMDGETFLMAAQVGMWALIVRKNMPSSRFLLQEDTAALLELSNSSSLPGFSTDLTLRVLGNRGSRISVPFSDPNAYTDYYCICTGSEQKKYRKWYSALERRTS